MYFTNPDGTVYDDTEATIKNFKFEVYIDPTNYQKLTSIARENGLLTLDPGTVINFVIRNFPQNC